MDVIFLLFVLLSSLLISIATIASLKKKLFSIGIYGKDINKEGEPKVPEAGGILLLPAIWICTLVLIIFFGANPISYAMLFLISSFCAIGFFDDGFHLFKKNPNWAFHTLGKGILLLLCAAIFSFIVFTYFGGASAAFFGAGTLLFVLFGTIIIVLCASFSNSFAGLNGWEVGSSVIIIAGLLVMAIAAPEYTETLLFLCVIALGAAIGLFFFNRYPAKVFPGDSGTLLLGAFIGAIILFLPLFPLALLLFIPHFIDIGLKLATNGRDISQKNERPYGQKGNLLSVPASGRLDFAKLILKLFGPKTERGLVTIILFLVLLNSFIWCSLYILLS